MHPVSVRNEAARRVVGMTHVGAYQDIAGVFEALGPRLAAAGLFAQARAMLGIFHDGPEVPDDRKRSLAGAEVGADVTCPEGLEEERLAGGRYAVTAFKGPYTGLAAAYEYLYGPWAGQAGETIRMAPCFEVYLDDPREVPPEELRTDIYVPLV